MEVCDVLGRESETGEGVGGGGRATTCIVFPSTSSTFTGLNLETFIID